MWSGDWSLPDRPVLFTFRWVWYISGTLQPLAWLQEKVRSVFLINGRFSSYHNQHKNVRWSCPKLAPVALSSPLPVHCTWLITKLEWKLNPSYAKWNIVSISRYCERFYGPTECYTRFGSKKLGAINFLHIISKLDFMLMLIEITKKISNFTRVGKTLSIMRN